MSTFKKILVFAILLMLYFSASVFMYDSLNAIALYVVLPCAFILTLLYSKQININKYFGIIVLLYLWILFASLFSSDIEESIKHLRQLVSCLIISYIFVLLSRNEKIIPWVYLIYIFGLAAMIHYMASNVFGIIDVGEERADDEYLNANTLAYYTFFTTFIAFIWGEMSKKNLLRKFLRILFWGTIPLSLWIAYITASRQVLIIQIPLILVLLFLRYWKFGNKISRISIIILLCGLIPIMYNEIIPMFDNSLLQERSQERVGDDARSLLIRESIDMGLNNPLVGVGPGCVKLFTTERAFAHNTFLELFAGSGILGVLIFVILLWKYLITQIRYYVSTRDKMFLYFIIFGVFFIVDQFFYVFYSSMYLISFFILVASHSETYYLHRLSISNKNNL